MNSCAVTEHGWMASNIDFYKQFTKAGLKPLLGCEIYCTDDPDNSEERTRDNHHMVIIAKDNTGYSKLLELVSNAALNNFYYKPRVWREHLRELSGHAVATSACLSEDTLVTTSEGIITIKELSKLNKEVYILSYDTETKSVKFSKVINAWKTKKVSHLLKITLENGSCIELTEDHLVYTDEGWIRADKLNVQKHKVLDLNIK